MEDNVSMSSRSSSSSRNTVVRLLRNDGGDFPKTPTKTEGAGQIAASKSQSAVSTPNIRERRGRSSGANGTFRPLSIFTNSMLLPFDHNFDKAFEVLKGDSPDRLKIAKSLLSADTQECLTRVQAGNTAANGSNPRPDPDLDIPQKPTDPDIRRSCLKDKEVTTPQRPISTFAMRRQTSPDDSNMDLMTALRMTSPEKDSCARVTADFHTLCELPVPNPSDHPAFASNPFEVRTEAPLLFTSTSADEIRMCSSKNQRHSDKSSSIGRQSIDRKKSLFGLGLSTPSIKSRNAFTSSEDSPFSILIPSPTSKSIQSSVKGTSPIATEFAASRNSTNTERNSGVRKFSGLFKRKDSLENGDPQSPTWSSRLPPDSPFFDRQQLERTLRRSTNTPTFDFDPYSAYPRHPNTGRGWKSRNLKCTTCLSVDCAVCHRVCCAYRAAVLALETHGEDSPGRPLAVQRIHEITKLYPYGKEAPTFLQCTPGYGGDEMGCGRMVCPDCCSICPDDACADTVCRRCKPAMWEECDWHADGKLISADQHEAADDG